MNPFMTSYRCVACNLFFNNFDEQKQHYFINHHSQPNRNFQAFSKPFSPSFVPNGSFLKSSAPINNNSNTNLATLTSGNPNNFNSKAKMWPRKRTSSGISPVKCEICDVECTSRATYDDHVKGKKHIKNLNKVKTPTETPNVKPDTESNSYYCEVCEVQCCGKDPLEMHLKGIRHQKKLKMKIFEELKLKKDPSVFCEICDVYLQQEMMEKHRESGKHKRKNPAKVDNSPRKKMKMVQPAIPTTLVYCGYCHQNLINEEDAIEHYQSAKHSSNLQNRSKDFELWCDLCQTSFHSKEILDKHLSGFKHFVKANRGNKNPEGEMAVKLLNQRKKMQLLKSKKKSAVNSGENVGTDNGDTDIKSDEPASELDPNAAVV